MLQRYSQHVAGYKQHVAQQQVACIRQQVARPSNMLPGNMLPWCKRGFNTWAELYGCVVVIQGS